MTTHDPATPSARANSSERVDSMRTAISRWVAIETAAADLVSAADNSAGRRSVFVRRLAEAANDMTAALNVPEPSTSWMRLASDTAPTLTPPAETPDEVERKSSLTADFVNALPGGTRDQSTYSDVEDALDRAGAPCRDGARWLTLPERIAALRPAPSSSATAPAVTGGVVDLNSWEANIEFLLSKCPDTVRVCEGGGPEDLKASLVTTFMRMQARLATPTPAPTQAGEAPAVTVHHHPDNDTTIPALEELALAGGSALRGYAGPLRPWIDPDAAANARDAEAERIAALATSTPAPKQAEWRRVSALLADHYDLMEVGNWNGTPPQWVSHMARRLRDGSWVTSTGDAIAEPDWCRDRATPPQQDEPR